MARPILHDYAKSSAAYRVRIALNLKGVDYARQPVDLVANRHLDEDYRALNPAQLVPTLEIDGHRLTQSLAIIGYLEARYPEPRLLPADPADAAHVRALALTIACDIHPVNNLRVRRYLSQVLGIDKEAGDAWYAHWVAEGFAALEALAAPRAGKFLFGDTPSLADVCLVPQMYNARRFELPLDSFPTLVRADAAASALDAFAAAHPDQEEMPA